MEDFRIIQQHCKITGNCHCSRKYYKYVNLHSYISIHWLNWCPTWLITFSLICWIQRYMICCASHHFCYQQKSHCQRLFTIFNISWGVLWTHYPPPNKWWHMGTISKTLTNLNNFSWPGGSNKSPPLETSGTFSQPVCFCLQWKPQGGGSSKDPPPP